MTVHPDPGALYEALLRIADDHAQFGSIRAEAKQSSYGPSGLKVDDLGEETLIAALRERILARADRPGRPDDLESLRRRLDPQ